MVEEALIEPAEVQIAGRPDVLKEIDKITIPAEALENNRDQQSYGSWNRCDAISSGKYKTGR